MPGGAQLGVNAAPVGNVRLKPCAVALRLRLARAREIEIMLRHHHRVAL